MSELQFKPVRPSAIWDLPGIDRVIEENYAECANQSLGPAKPDRELYTIFENAGIAFAVCVFDGEKVVGGVIVVVNTMAHFSKPVACTESLFLLPEYRRTGAGMKLLRIAKAMAKGKGSPGLYITAPVGSRLERLLRFKKVKQTNSVFFDE